jgi:hypothetical protein
VRTWFRGLTARGSVHRRRLAQGLVEYGMIVAAVAFVGMVGLQFVGRAEESLLGGEPLASTPPVAGFFLHPTSTGIICASSYIAGTALNCTATVDDTFLPVAQAFSPGGSVRLRLDATQIATCTLAPVGGTHYSQCLLSYTFAQSDSGSHSLVADYFGQTTDHNTSSSSPLPVTIAKNIGFQFPTCNNPWTGADFSATIGQPLICQIQVIDGITGTPWPAGESVHVTAVSSAAGGLSFFSCFTDYSNDMSPGHSNSHATIAGCPTPQSSIDCVTVAGGSCAWQGQTRFLYRKTLDDSQQPAALPVTDFLRASALGQSTDSGPIAITPTANRHETETLVQCTAPSLPATSRFIRLSPIPLIGDAEFGPFPPFSMQCTAAVLDLDPNTTFDWPNCSNVDPRFCNIDDVDTHGPLGQARFSIVDRVTGTPLGVRTCNLHGPALGPPPSNLPAQPQGQIRYASWCTTDVAGPNSLTFSAGTEVNIIPSYNGGPGHWQSSHPGSLAADTMHIDVP